MGITELFDETIELLKGNFIVFAGICAVAVVPLALLEGMLTMSTQNTVYPDGTVEWQSAKQWFAWIVAGGLLKVVSLIIYTAALTIAVSKSYLGEKVTIAESYMAIFKDWIILKLLGLTIVQIIIVGGPFTALVAMFISVTIFFEQSALAAPLTIGVFILFLPIGILSLFLIVKLALVEVVCVLENRFMDSLKRSWRLMQGQFWKAVVVGIIAILIQQLVQTIIGMPAIIMTLPATLQGDQVSGLASTLTVLLGAVGETITAPITVIWLILLYYDSRIRKEAFDLEMLAAQMNSGDRDSYERLDSR